MADDTNNSGGEPAFVHFFSSVAGMAAVVGSVFFVFAIIYVLSDQLNEIENSARSAPVDDLVEKISEKITFSPKEIELIGQLYMESDAQYLRSERAQSLTGARLTVMIVAEMIGLSLVVLGGAMIFARIKGINDLIVKKGGLPTDTEAAGITSKLGSEYPGVFLCLFGAVVVGYSLYTSTQTKIKTQDSPLFFPSSGYAQIVNPIDINHGKESALNDICIDHAPNPEHCN